MRKGQHCFKDKDGRRVTGKYSSYAAREKAIMRMTGSLKDIGLELNLSRSSVKRIKDKVKAREEAKLKPKKLDLNSYWRIPTHS